MRHAMKRKDGIIVMEKKESEYRSDLLDKVRQSHYLRLRLRLRSSQ